jgi:hypothetical protein
MDAASRQGAYKAIPRTRNEDIQTVNRQSPTHRAKQQTALKKSVEKSMALSETDFRNEDYIIDIAQSLDIAQHTIDCGNSLQGVTDGRQENISLKQASVMPFSERAKSKPNKMQFNSRMQSLTDLAPSEDEKGAPGASPSKGNGSKQGVIPVKQCVVKSKQKKSDASSLMSVLSSLA